MNKPNKPFNMITPTHDAKKFVWHGNNGSADVSDFGTSGRIAGPCWNDSCDHGMTLYSRRTGKFVEFVETGVTTDPDDKGILYWTYRSLCERFTLTIFTTDEAADNERDICGC